MSDSPERRSFFKRAIGTGLGLTVLMVLAFAFVAFLLWLLFYLTGVWAFTEL